MEEDGGVWLVEPPESPAAATGAFTPPESPPSTSSRIEL